MQAGIEVLTRPEVAPTLCAPISSFKALTSVSDAYLLGELGFVMGIITAALFWVGVYYVGPWIACRSTYNNRGK